MEHKIKNVSQRGILILIIERYSLYLSQTSKPGPLWLPIWRPVSGGHVESCVLFFFFFCLAELSARIVLAGATVNSRHSTASFNKFFQAVFLEFFQ